MKWIRRAAIGALLAAVSSIVIISIVTGELLLTPRPPVPDYGIAEVRADSTTVAYAGGAPDVDRPGIAGLTWSGGWARLGPPTAHDDGLFVRQVLERSDPVPPCSRAACELYDLNGWASGEDPGDRGFNFREVVGDSPNGSFSGWLVEPEIPDPEIWVVIVHGYGADRREGLRFLDVLREVGAAVLIMSYRNDDPSHPGDDGRYGYGSTEWGDLEAAVSFARQNGASCIVPFGLSTGAAIAASFLERSEAAADVCGVIMDSANLDVRATVEHAFEVNASWLPELLRDPGLELAQMWYDLSWSAWDYVRISKLSAPALMFHGQDDRIVPVDTSEAFAESHANVSLHTYPGAGHVASWNSNRLEYESVLSEFLENLKS